MGKVRGMQVVSKIGNSEDHGRRRSRIAHQFFRALWLIHLSTPPQSDETLNSQTPVAVLPEAPTIEGVYFARLGVVVHVTELLASPNPESDSPRKLWTQISPSRRLKAESILKAAPAGYG